MCLITEQKEPIVAKRAITVYKYVDKYEEGMFYPVFYSNVVYMDGETYEVDMIADNIFGSVADNVSGEAYGIDWRLPRSILQEQSAHLTHVHEGFHSFKTASRCKYHMYSCNALIKCQIPQGALYYKDKTGLYASNKLKVIGIV